MNNPLVSIIIPTFNRANLIGETLDSIVAQTFKDWECIIVDDGSTDNSKAIINEYISNDNRFLFFKRPNNLKKGANSCRNFGFKKSSGNFIKWFDNDDIMHPDFLQKQVNIMQNNPEVHFCSSNYATFLKSVEEDKVDFEVNSNLVNNPIVDFLLGNLNFLTPSPLWRKSFLEGKILFDINLQRAQETDFNFRRLTENAHFYHLQDILFYVRRGHDSIDKKAATNPISLASAYKYYNKVYQYLISKKNILNANESRILQNYYLVKQSMFLYNNYKVFYKKDIIRFYFQILTNIVFSNMNLKYKIRLFFGNFVCLVTKTGWKYIYIKELYNIKENQIS